MCSFFFLTDHATRPAVAGRQPRPPAILMFRYLIAASPSPILKPAPRESGNSAPWHSGLWIARNPQDFADRFSWDCRFQAIAAIGIVQVTISL
jgi:hypothetical protein